MVKWYVAAALAVLILISGVLSAAENPTVQYRTGYGFLFLMPDGTERFCGLDSETTVRCQNAAGVIWNCQYVDPPVYFTDCRIE